MSTEFMRGRWAQTGMTPAGALAAAWQASDDGNPDDARWLIARAIAQDPALAPAAEILRASFPDLHAASSGVAVATPASSAPSGKLTHRGTTLHLTARARVTTAVIDLEIDGHFHHLRQDSLSLGESFDLAFELPPTARVVRASVDGHPLAGSPLVLGIGAEPCPPAVQKPDETPFLWVLIPVHGAFRAVQRCLNSVLASRNRVPFKVLVVDDASPEPDLRGWLEDKARAGVLELLQRPINGGYVAAVNTGLRTIGARDVVILNSDTVVTDHWVDRLVRVAESAADIGAVNPLSNHAELLSVPRPMQANPMPDPSLQQALVQLLARRFHGQSVEIPAAVGFCWYLKGQALASVGLLDETLIARGYGEDTEYSVRLQREGWRSVVALDSYVAHEGAQSFRENRRRLAAVNLRLMDRLHPEHELAYQRFLRARPFDEAFHRIQHARLQEGAAQGACLILGDEVTLRRHERFATEPFWMLVPTWRAGTLNEVRLHARGVPVVAEIRWAWPREAAAMMTSFTHAGFSSLRRETYADWPATLIDLIASLNLKREASLVDASGYCPRRHAARVPHEHCDEPAAVSACEACVSQHGALQRGVGHLASWREAVREDLAQCDQRTAGSVDLAARLSQRMTLHFNALPQAATPKSPRRIGFLHVLDAGGLALMEALAAAITSQGSTLRMVVLGDTPDPERLARFPCVELPGDTEARTTADLLDSLQVNALGDPALSEDGHVRQLAARLGRGYLDRAALESLGNSLNETTP